MQLTTSLSSLLAPGLKHVYDDQWRTDEALDQYKLVVNIETSEKAYEQFLKTGGIGPAIETAEGQPIQFEEIAQTTVQKITQKTFTKGFEVSVQMWQDDLYGVIEQTTRRLARSGRLAFELQGWDLFNAGFVTTTRTTNDGLALFSAAHTLINPSGFAPGNPTTFSNTATAALGYASYQAGIEAGLLTVDEEGFPAPIQFEYLLAQPTDIILAQQLTSPGKDGGQYGTNDNQQQPAEMIRIKPVTINWFTNTGQWALVASKKDHDLMMFVRMQPVLMHADNPYTKAALINVMGRCAVGAVDARGVYSAKP